MSHATPPVPAYELLEREVCQVCEREYPIWSAPSPLWNRVMRNGVRANPDRFAFICPTCFGLAADEQNGEPLLWTLMEDGKGDEYLRAELHQAWTDKAELFEVIQTLERQRTWAEDHLDFAERRLVFAHAEGPTPGDLSHIDNALAEVRLARAALGSSYTPNRAVGGDPE